MKLPVRSKDTPLKKSLYLLYNKTIENLHKESSHRERISIIQDRYYRSKVTADLAFLIHTLFPTKTLRKEKMDKDSQSQWKTVTNNRKSSSSSRTASPFIIPTTNSKQIQKLGKLSEGVLPPIQHTRSNSNIISQLDGHFSYCPDSSVFDHSINIITTQIGFRPEKTCHSRPSPVCHVI